MWIILYKIEYIYTAIEIYTFNIAVVYQLNIIAHNIIKVKIVCCQAGYNIRVMRITVQDWVCNFQYLCFFDDFIYFTLRMIISLQEIIYLKMNYTTVYFGMNGRFPKEFNKNNFPSHRII